MLCINSYLVLMLGLLKGVGIGIGVLGFHGRSNHGNSYI